MRLADAIDLARTLDGALGAALRVMRTIQYGGEVQPDELRRIVDLGERARNGAAWISQGELGREDASQLSAPKVGLDRSTEASEGRR